MTEKYGNIFTFVSFHRYDECRKDLDFPAFAYTGHQDTKHTQDTTNTGIIYPFDVSHSQRQFEMHTQPNINQCIVSVIRFLAYWHVYLLLWLPFACHFLPWAIAWVLFELELEIDFECVAQLESPEGCIRASLSFMKMFANKWVWSVCMCNCVWVCVCGTLAKQPNVGISRVIYSGHVRDPLISLLIRPLRLY